MPVVFLIRHGDVAGNSGARRTYVGWRDEPLTPHGESQARAVARRLAREPLAAVYSSDLRRAARTAELVAAEHGLQVQRDPALREVNYGAWEGLSQAEISGRWPAQWERRLADPLHERVPDGESLLEMWVRWQVSWQAILQRHGPEAVAIVSHNASLRVLLCYLLGAPLQHYRRIHLDNCGLSRVDTADDRAAKSDHGAPPLRVSSINETCHLSGR